MEKRERARSKPSARLAALGAIPFATLAACVADLGPGGPEARREPGSTTAGGSGGPGESTGPGSFQPAEPVPLQAASGGLRRLSVNEYRASVGDLLPIEPPAADTFEADTPVNGFTSIGASRVAFPAQQVERFEQASYEMAAQIFDDEVARAEFVGCSPASESDPCVQEFLTRFGRRTFRRPLSAEEVSQFSALVTSVASSGDGSDVWTGLAYAVAAFLQSPSFLYRPELGSPTADAAGHRSLDGFEVATRLAYLITGSTPDDQLLDAAEAGLLDDAAGLAGELERLLTLPRAEDALSRFLEEQFEVERVGKIVKVPDAFPTFTPELAEAMQYEMGEAFRDVALRQEDDILTLLTRRETTVNGPLAELYGVPGPATPTEWASATLPEDGPRAGLLGFAGFLASHAGPAETSVTKRGFFIVSKLMCTTIPSPPEDVETQLPEPPEGGHATMRERVEQHMSDPSCSNCHRAMDPPGLALEHFDALGSYRELDGGLPIDATGEMGGQPFDGARELGALLQEHPAVAQCIASRFYEFALGTQDHPGAPTFDLVQAFQDSGRRYPELVRALVMHDAFRLVSAPR